MTQTLKNIRDHIWLKVHRFLQRVLAMSATKVTGDHFACRNVWYRVMFPVIVLCQSFENDGKWLSCSRSASFRQSINFGLLMPEVVNLVNNIWFKWSKGAGMAILM